MSSSCIEEVSVPNDDWYRIAAELLSRAGIEINGPAPSDLRIKNPHFFKRVLQEGSLGLGESYMDGWWDCERLDIFFHKVLRAGLENQLPHHFKDTLRIATARLFNLQSKKRSWIVGKEHYDLGNDLFSRMLDPYMQYSCAYWKDAHNLEDAQQAKLDLICRKLQLEPGMRVLDIGCGWGGLAYYMVKITRSALSASRFQLSSKKWPSSAAQVLTLLSCCRITATCKRALTVSSQSACLNMSGRKITPPTSTWSTGI